MDETKKLNYSYNTNLDITKKFFFIGICGIGMSALAQYLNSKKITVSGSDSNINQDIAKILIKNNISLFNELQVTDEILNLFDIIIVTNTVFENNPVLILAKKNKKIILYRSQLLQAILQNKKVIGVTGSHGKTTTTGILGKIFSFAHLSPTIFIGGIMPEFNTNYISGDSQYAIVEADDAYRSFLDLSPFYSIITTISYEHLETYASWQDIEDTFLAYANSTNSGGAVIVNIDTDFMINFSKKINHKEVLTYGISEQAEYKIKNVWLQEKKSQFDLYHKENYLSSFEIPLLGLHNIKNTVATIVVSLKNNIALPIIKNALLYHQGVKRRFEFMGKTKEGIAIYDDYGHHPVELEATLSVLKIKNNLYNYVFFQPHKYTRTKHLWHDFISVFVKYKDIITKLYITDVYDVGDPYDETYNSKNLVPILQSLGCRANYLSFDKKFTHFFSFKKELTINPEQANNSIILTLGAGVLNNLAVNFINN